MERMEGEYQQKVEACTDVRSLFSLWKNKPESGPIRIQDEHSVRQIRINHGANGFIADGIVDAPTWKEQKRKILFVLKEAYHDKRAEYDLSASLKVEGPWGSVWNRCAEWISGICRADRGNPLPPYQALSWGDANSLLKSCAVLNLKKSDGNSSSCMGEIAEYAQYDHLEIKQQIKIINPDIVICGSVLYLLKEHVYGDALLGNGQFRGERNDNWYYWTTALTGKPTLVIDFYHPANRYPAVLNYYALMGVYHQAVRDCARMEPVGRIGWLNT